MNHRLIYFWSGVNPHLMMRQYFKSIFCRGHRPPVTTWAGDEDDVLSILVLGLGISIVFCLFQRLHLCYSSMRRGDASVAPAGKFVGVGQLRDDEVNFAEAKLC